MKSTNPICFCSQPENSISNDKSSGIFFLIWWLEHYTCILSRSTFCVSSGTCIPYPKINALNKLKTGFIFYSNTRTHNCKSTLKQIWSLTKRPSPYNLNDFLFSERFRAIKFQFLHLLFVSYKLLISFSQMKVSKAVHFLSFHWPFLWMETQSRISPNSGLKEYQVGNVMGVFKWSHTYCPSMLRSFSPLHAEHPLDVLLGQLE